jgi:hypothetical protein
MKVTPMDLAQEPLRFVVEEHRYDFSTQRRVGLNSIQMITVNGTQTFGSHGNPIDRDND